ncbi:hypothetical protein D9758_006540 [Tetrapyrgos nigripes]|uniref:Uncharacterized protein n=1 Tax=Tetrapyrgos nigripes TaxID=182062 RepID=A0A8H5GKN2_9AGAR|nr:hypothetical protein D9758_006540 [Tetrapyrgos nigripes]
MSLFSSITSFLPSALHPSSPPPPDSQPEIDDDDDDEEPNVEQVDTKKSKKDKKEKGPNETFIFVRPPPAKSNHPLNLQVQLVPPHSRAPGGVNTSRQSLDAQSDTGGGDLSRTTSAQSEASSYSNNSSNTSGYASTSSFSSTYSTSSTTSSGGRRIIIPLYNLQAHNVMTNTVVDAGTDAKIAKFTKKGLEMIDLAVLEPVEVWPTPAFAHHTRAGPSVAKGKAGLLAGASTSGTGTGGTGSARPSVDAEHTPASSAVSLSSYGVHDSLHHQQQQHQHPDTSPYSYSHAPAAASSTPKKNNLFGKFFSRDKRRPEYGSGPGSTSTSTPAIDLSITAPTPTQTKPDMPLPASPTPLIKGHARNLSNSINNAFRRSPSPAMGSAGTVTGGGLTPRRTTFFSRDRSGGGSESGHRQDVSASASGVGDTLNPGITTSRLSTSSRHSQQSRHSQYSATEDGQIYNRDARTHAREKETKDRERDTPVAVSLPSTLGIQPTLSTPGGPAALAANFGSVNGPNNNPTFLSAGYPPPKHLGYGKGPALYVWVVRRWTKKPSATSSRDFDFSGGLPVPGPLAGLKEVFTEGSRRSFAGERERETGAGAGLGTSGMKGLELRVEWKRGKKPKTKKKKLNTKAKDEQGGSGPGSKNPSRDVSMSRAPANTNGNGSQGSLPTSPNSNGHSHGATLQAESPVDKTANRLSTLSALSAASTNVSASEDTHSNTHNVHNNDFAEGGPGSGPRPRHSLSLPGSVNSRKDKDNKTKDGKRFKSKQSLRTAFRSASRTDADDDGDSAGEVGSEGSGSVRGRRRATGRGGGGGGGGETDGEETDGEAEYSDPEDSETPWVCTVKVRRLGRNERERETQGPLKLKVGTLSPTPHHPKVVAMLKVPYPLPDLEVERMSIRRRGLPGVSPGSGSGDDTNNDTNNNAFSGSGSGGPGGGCEGREPLQGLSLTAEEIKDVVCSTGLWLVVREGFGGVGRVSRKGDGWRIRA